MDEHGWREPATGVVLDAEALKELVADVGAAEADLFARRYLDLLEERVLNLRLAAAAADLDGVHEAALSLRTTSAMVGAEELAGAVAALPPAQAGARGQRSTLQDIEVAAAMTTGALVARATAAVPGADT
jgi:hypothetical protein